MRYGSFAALALLCVAVGSGMGRAAEPAQKSIPQTFAELLPGMGADDIAARKDPQQAWQQICFKAGTPGNEAQRAEVCKLMIEKLGSGTPAAARIWLLTQLQWIGRGECVDAVAANLDDKDEKVRDAARRALARNPAPEAVAKLRAKLAGAPDGRFKAGLINALGDRADEAAVPALAQALGSQDKLVAEAAARALGKIAGAEAAQALAAARPKAAGDLRLRISDSCLLCADKILKQGKVQDAAAMYKQLYHQDEPRGVRLAALKGVLATAGDRAGAMVLEFLGASDPAVRRIAIEQAAGVSAEAVRQLAAGLPKLPPAGQVALLAALAARRDKAALPAVLAAIKSDDEGVKIAAIQAVGPLGDGSAVSMLVELMGVTGAIGDAARGSLERLLADDVDQKLIERMKGAKDARERNQFVDILERRLAVSAVPVLLADAACPTAEIRRRAIGALNRLAGPQHVSAMIKVMLSSNEPAERSDLEKAIVTACQRVSEGDKQSDAVFKAYTTSNSTEKVALLPLLGRIGGAQVLEIARTALASSNAEEYESGVKAICNWPDGSAAEELLKLAQNAKESENRVRALRAFARVVVLQQPSRSTKEKLKLLKQGMELATRDQDRSLIIERTGAVRDINALRFVVPYLSEPELAQAACRTVVELAHHKELREPNKDEFEKALDKVILTTKDKKLVERAAKYKTGPWPMRE